MQGRHYILHDLLIFKMANISGTRFRTWMVNLNLVFSVQLLYAYDRATGFRDMAPINILKHSPHEISIIPSFSQRATEFHLLIIEF